MRKTLLALLSLSVSLAAQSLTLSIDPKGIVVDGGVAGRVVLGAPIIGGADKKDRKPVFAMAADGSSATATYADGFVIRIALSPADGTIIYGFDHAPAGATSIKITATLPLSYADGGVYATNGGQAHPFPGELDKQLFAQGSFNQLDLVTGTGEGLSFFTPASYQQLQDNRIWKTSSFSWVYHYDLLRYPNETSFVVRVAAIKK